MDRLKSYLAARPPAEALRNGNGAPPLGQHFKGGILFSPPTPKTPDNRRGQPGQSSTLRSQTQRITITFQTQDLTHLPVTQSNHDPMKLARHNFPQIVYDRAFPTTTKQGTNAAVRGVRANFTRTQQGYREADDGLPHRSSNNNRGHLPPDLLNLTWESAEEVSDWATFPSFAPTRPPTQPARSARSPTQPARPLTQSARPTAQPARPLTQSARPPAQPARPLTQSAHPPTQSAPTPTQSARPVRHPRVSNPPTARVVEMSTPPADSAARIVPTRNQWTQTEKNFFPTKQEERVEKKKKRTRRGKQRSALNGCPSYASPLTSLAQPALVHPHFHPSHNQLAHQGSSTQIYCYPGSRIVLVNNFK